jgi:tripartite-type tricarboxylate transporter receptor subunit TctC
MFRYMAGINRAPAKYWGEESSTLADLIGGQAQVTFATLPSAIEYIRSGTLRALAVTDVKRAEVLPDVPTVGEFVSGYQAASFQGIGAPRGTPSEVIRRLNAEINALLADDKVKARLANLGSTALALSPEEFAQLIAGETQKWSNAIRAARIMLQ